MKFEMENGEFSAFVSVDEVELKQVLRLEIVDFLKRLYKLDTWKSGDSRMKNAEQEIAMHTRNGDYSDNWIFDDERFHLIDGTDNICLSKISRGVH